jgi:hypothetical protein
MESLATGGTPDIPCLRAQRSPPVSFHVGRHRTTRCTTTFPPFRPCWAFAFRLLPYLLFLKNKYSLLPKA